MKKYQKYSIVCLCLAVCVAASGIVSFFVPTMGIIEKSDSVEYSAAISVFDGIRGDFNAPVKGDPFVEGIQMEVNVAEELVEKDYIDFMQPMFIICLVLGLLGFISATISHCLGYKKMDDREKYKVRWIGLISTAKFFLLPTIGSWAYWVVALAFNGVGNSFEKLYYIPICIFLILMIALAIAIRILSKAVVKDIDKEGDNFVPGVFLYQKSHDILSSEKADEQQN